MKKTEKKEIVKIQNLNFSYDDNCILKNLNLIIYKGEFIGITGVNGAGKSTLVKLILGELKIKSGDIFIEDKNIKNFKNMNRIGYVPQLAVGKRADFPATALETVMLNLYPEIGLFRLPQKKHRLKAHDALKLVGMEEYCDRMIGKLSGGQQQRVMIAKALVSDPEILIMDEPTTGVDTDTTKQIFDLLKHLNKLHGITIAVISHDLPYIYECADRIFNLKDKCAEEIKLGN